MDLFATIPNPDPSGLPAPVGLMKTLLVLTFTLHLCAMNFLVGATLFVAVAMVKRRDAFYADLSNRLSRALPPAMALTITLGIPPLLFLQVLYGQAFYTTSVLIAWPWLSVIALLFVAYYGLYLVQYRPAWLGNGVRWVGWLSWACILAVGYLWTTNSTLMLNPSNWGPLYEADPWGTRLATADPSFWGRLAHMLVGAVAVGGLGVAWWAQLYARDHSEWVVRVRKLGATWFTVCTVINFGVGFWFLFSLPEPVRMKFLGQSGHATGVLWLGVILALGAMHFAFSRTGIAVLLTFVTLLSMAMSRESLREYLLGPSLKLADQKVHPQWALLVLFAALLVAGLIAIAWMLRAYTTRRQESGAEPVVD